MGVGNEWSGSRAHGGGGTRVVALKLMWWMSSQAQIDMVGVRDNHSGSKRHGQGGDERLGWEGHGDECSGLRRHGQGGRQAFRLEFKPSMSARMSTRGRKRTHVCRFAIVVLVIVAIIVVVVVVVVSSLSQDEGVVVVVVARERMGVYMNAFSFGQSEALSVQP